MWTVFPTHLVAGDANLDSAASEHCAVELLLDQPTNFPGLTTLPEADSLSRQVERLSADSYITRQQAAAVLLEAGVQAIGPLRRTLTSGTLEARLQSQRLLREIHDRRTTIAWNQLLQGHDDIDAQALPHWNAFRDSVGDSPDSRRLYVDLLRRHQEMITALSGDQLCGYRLTRRMNADPRQLHPQDYVRWTGVLLQEITSGGPQPSSSTTHSSLARRQLLAALSGESSGPTLLFGLTPSSEPTLRFFDSTQADLLRRLIAVWIRCRECQIDTRTLLSIAIRYRCDEQALRLCERILDRPHDNPQSITMALLASAALEHPRLDGLLAKYQADRRISQQWKLSGGEGKALQTRVQDVVVALRLREKNIDPRTVGFHELLADPSYVYRYQSLGFRDESERQRTFSLATNLLSGR